MKTKLVLLFALIIYACVSLTSCSENSLLYEQEMSEVEIDASTAIDTVSTGGGQFGGGGAGGSW